MKRFITYILLLIITPVFLTGAVMLCFYYNNTNEAYDKLLSLSELKYSQPISKIENEPVTVEDENPILPEYRTLYNINSDMVGWLQINDTNIDYPVMQNQKEYYINRDFNKEYSSVGLPFADERCDIESENIIIYAHNIKSGLMFYDLLKFANEDFRTEHSLIYFDTLYEKRVYSVESTRYFIDSDIFDDYSSEKDLLILITCSYHATNGRFALIAKRIE